MPAWPQVPTDKAAGVAAAATAENLNRALASSGISVGAVSSNTVDAAQDTVTATETAAPVDGSSGGLSLVVLAGIGAGVLVLVVAAGAGACWWHRSRRAQQEECTQSVRIPTCPVP